MGDGHVQDTGVRVRFGSGGGGERRAKWRRDRTGAGRSTVGPFGTF